MFDYFNHSASAAAAACLRASNLAYLGDHMPSLVSNSSLLSKLVLS